MKSTPPSTASLIAPPDTHRLKNQRIGLLTHRAAIQSNGISTATWFHNHYPDQLRWIMSPEHGYFGHAAAGETFRSSRHPDWKIPLHSLYGDTRSPRHSWLKQVDWLIIDIQDLGFRPYTYVSTLQLTLETAAQTQTPVMVLDRPIPLPNTIDGPMLVPRQKSFVSAIDSPMVYAMTPAETARWLQQTQFPSLELFTAPLPLPIAINPKQPFPWIPPSPAIRTWEIAMTFPSTVAFEGLPQIDHNRHGDLPFQRLGAPWIKPAAWIDALADCRLPGVAFHRDHFHRPGSKRLCPGIRLTITNPRQWQPIKTTVALLATLADTHGVDRIWHHPRTRHDFFDKLMGTAEVRLALMDKSPWPTICKSWKRDIKTFRAQRSKALLYPRNKETTRVN